MRRVGVSLILLTAILGVHAPASAAAPDYPYGKTRPIYIEQPFYVGDPCGLGYDLDVTFAGWFKGISSPQGNLVSLSNTRLTVTNGMGTADTSDDVSVTYRDTGTITFIPTEDGVGIVRFNGIDFFATYGTFVKLTGHFFYAHTANEPLTGSGTVQDVCEDVT